MSRHFTIPKMLRMTPNALLKELFDRLGVRLYSIDWKRLKERQVEPLLNAIGWAPREDQDKVESVLANIFELACEAGWQAILDVAREQGETSLTSQVPEEACPYERAVWTWLTRPDLFQDALVAHQLETQTGWRKRIGLPVIVPRITPDSIRELAKGLSQCLRREEGRGKNCTVEYYRRRDGADCFLAYPDDFTQTITTHDHDGTLITQSLRKTFEIVFALRADVGTLELCGKFSPTIRPKLESVFGQIIMGVDLAHRSYRRPYDLNRLKDRYFCLETDPIDRISASIIGLTLDLPKRIELTVGQKRQSYDDDIFEQIDECLNAEVVRWDEVSINSARFRFQFEATATRRPSTLTFDVTYPDRCSIKTRRPDRLDLTRKYLRRWRIADV